MKFIHVYNEDFMKGLEINGLLNKDSGFKLQHCFCVPLERTFNNYAKVGGKFHSMVKENGYTVYVDRIAPVFTVCLTTHRSTMRTEHTRKQSPITWKRCGRCFSAV